MSKNLTLGAFVLIGLIMSGAYVVNELDKSKTYFCTSSSMIGLCEKLSSSMTRCYYNGTKYKTCSDGWKPYFNQNLCWTDNTYSYCCKNMSGGSCDIIIRS
jgi:hypothetical protein